MSMSVTLEIKHRASNKTIRSEILDAAVNMTQNANIRPAHLKRRLKIIGAIFVFSLLGVAVMLGIIISDQPQADHIRFLIAFVLLGSAAVAFSALISAFILLWRAYVYRHIHELETKNELMDMSAQHVKLVEKGQLVHLQHPDGKTALERGQALSLSTFLILIAL